MHAAVEYLVEDLTQIAASKPKNALTIDVEDYFQVAAFEQSIARKQWDSIESRVALATGRALDLFAAHGKTATFFVLGWVAERNHALVRRIVAEGHELASHGYEHTMIHQMTPAQFREEVTRVRKLLEDISGVAVRGFRAPSFSIDSRNLWALDILGETGHVYSSSIYPIHHDLYGMPDAPRFPFRLRPGAILEIPVTTIRLGGRNFPCGGGGYFRLLPYFAFRWMLKRVNQSDRQPGVFYFHPWELDPDQPRITHAPFKSRFRHYRNLDATHARLARLLTDFEWGRMDEVFGV